MAYLSKVWPILYVLHIPFCKCYVSLSKKGGTLRDREHHAMVQGVNSGAQNSSWTLLLCSVLSVSTMRVRISVLGLSQTEQVTRDCVNTHTGIFYQENFLLDLSQLSTPRSCLLTKRRVVCLPFLLLCEVMPSSYIKVWS